MGASGCDKYINVFKKFDWDSDVALEVCHAESAGVAHAVGDSDTAYESCGLMQIRTLPGRPNCKELKDPEFNITYAYKLWKESGWTPWSVCKNGMVDCVTHVATTV